MIKEFIKKITTISDENNSERTLRLCFVPFYFLSKVIDTVSASIKSKREKIIFCLLAVMTLAIYTQMMMGISLSSNSFGIYTSMAVGTVFFFIGLIATIGFGIRLLNNNNKEEI